MFRVRMRVMLGLGLGLGSGSGIGLGLGSCWGIGLFCCPSQSSQGFVCVLQLRLQKYNLTLSWEEAIVER
jgi:hypothetical protein